jgi:predicted metal-dependent enzyme (double-stranded beta helix superfamily)
MSLSYEQRTSEAPHHRAEQINELLSELDLPDGRLTPKQLELVVRVVADRPDLYEDLIIEDEQSRWWLLLYRSPSYEVKLLTWAAGQSSDWHDHGGSSGALTVTGGSLIERRRAADGVGVESSSFAVGAVTSFATDYLHDVDFESGHPAVSIHAYSPPLTGLTFYDRTPYGFAAREFVPEERRSEFRSTQPTVD